jgi:hypothetical protein
VEYRLRRSGDVDLVFDGVMLADVTEDAGPRSRTIRIYRTDSGKYVSENIGRSAVPGEKELHKVKVAESALELRTKMRRKKGRTRYLDSHARRALAEAERRDPDFVWNADHADR